LSPHDLALADFGVSEGVTPTPQLIERVTRKVTRIVEDQRRMVASRTGLAATEIAFSGQLTVLGEGENRLLKFDRPTELEYTPGTRWDQAGADIIGDIERMIEHIVAAGGVPTAIVGCGAMISLIMRNEDVEKVMDNRRSTVASEDYILTERQSGAFHRGSLFGLDVFAFDGTYKAPDGTVKYSVPRSKLLIACEVNGNVLHYGLAPIHYGQGTPGMIGNSVIDAENFIATAFLERRGVDCEAIQCVAPLQGDPASFGVINATTNDLPTAFAEPAPATSGSKGKKKDTK
jgi:hypothetical protein